MKIIILIALLFSNVYAQGFECDNNFGDCGTPDQSGGGGGGKGSVLIANTDLGDTYQSADDYDNDGIEDPSDNCMRDYNPQQLDSDADTIGDMCDNCIVIWNLYQDDSDGNGYGDACDDDIDGDGILNSDDECPYQWGNSYCIEETKQNYFKASEDHIYESPEYQHEDLNELNNSEYSNTGCSSLDINYTKNFLLLLGCMFFIAFFSNSNKR